MAEQSVGELVVELVGGSVATMVAQMAVSSVELKVPK